MVLARKVAGGGKTVRMSRVGEAQHGECTIGSGREIRHLEDGVAAHGLRTEVNHLDGLIATLLPVKRHGTPKHRYR